MRQPSDSSDTARPVAITVTRVVLHQIIKSLEMRGISAESLLPAVSSLDPPSHLIEHVPLDVLLTVWRRALLRTGERTFPIQVALEAQARPASMLGFLCRASSTPRHAVHSLIRFWSQVTGASRWMLLEAPWVATLALQPLRLGMGQPSSLHTSEWNLPSDAQEAGWMCQLEFDLLDVALGLRLLLSTDQRLTLGFPYALPDRYVRRLDELGFNVRCNVKAHCIEFDQRLLDRPLRQADAQLATFLEMQLEHEQIPPSYAADLVGQVRALLSVQLELGEPFLDRAAQQLGMSRRTLQRQLEDSGSSFRQLLEQVRQEQCHLYVGRLKADALAEKLGYSDVRALRRARRRWEAGTGS